MAPGAAAWSELASAVRREAPDLFLLPELPFGRWISGSQERDSAALQECEAVHAMGADLLHELGASIVLGTRAACRDGCNVNEAFLWTRQHGAVPVHTKQYFPNEEGYYEALWFQRGPAHFRVAESGPARIGFLICTEVMFNEHARRYGRDGANIIAVPRAVGAFSLPRWLTAMRMAAIVSGCYVLSSNRGGRDSNGQQFGGRGWIIDPAGDLVAQTSSASPVAFCEIDLVWVRRAQREYPCYVRELDG
jgi:N-carbamoylputrescine amidase